MQQRLTSYIRRPIKRQGAEHYLFVTLLSFAASVTLTRLLLALTGYPQLGGGELHISHALWGGLLLYIASLLPLLYANRWIYMAGAVLAGTGVGLFIDEVGKFITQRNDYFYPLAAPIIYAFFLLSVMVYLRVRRPPSRSVRAELFRVFDTMEEVLEQDLDQSERDDLEARLRYVAEHSGDRPDLSQLATDLLEFLRCEAVQLVPRRPGPIERMLMRWQDLERRWVTKGRTKALLSGSLLGLGLITLAKTSVALVLIRLVDQAVGPASGANPVLAFLSGAIRSWQVAVPRGVFRYADLALETVVGLMLVFAASLLFMGKDQLGTAFGSLGLVLSLTAVNLLVFYFDQFSGIFSALLQLLALTGLAYYRQRYVYPASAPP